MFIARPLFDGIKSRMAAMHDDDDILFVHWHILEDQTSTNQLLKICGSIPKINFVSSSVAP